MWKCKKCGERVENAFAVCWNCGTSRDGVEDPSFRRETDDTTPAPEARPKPAPPRPPAPAPIVTTGNEVSGRPITGYLGVVRGVVVRSPGIGQSFLGGLKMMVGGNIESFAEVCDAARRDAFERMVKHAAEVGADAVIGMRYDATEFAQGVTEVLAYGTAVKLGGAAGAPTGG